MNQKFDLGDREFSIRLLKGTQKRNTLLNMLSVDKVYGKFTAKLEQGSNANIFLEFDATLSFRLLLIFLLKNSKSHISC